VEHEPIAVLLVDDHAVLRETLRLLFDAQPDLRVVGEAGSGAAAVEAAVRLLPDVVVMDAAMPGLNGIEATRRMREQAPAARVLILSAHDEDSAVLAGLEAGAAGWLHKSAPSSEVIEAIREIQRNGSYLPSAYRRRPRIEAWLEGAQRSRRSHGEGELTSREREILRLMAQGQTARAIAEALVLSPKTIESHIQHIRAKLGTRNRAELTQHAIRLGLLFVDGPESATP
jgi:DNA-binding NarL/FixJ family response regulator